MARRRSTTLPSFVSHLTQKHGMACRSHWSAHRSRRVGVVSASGVGWSPSRVGLTRPPTMLMPSESSPLPLGASTARRGAFAVMSPARPAPALAVPAATPQQPAQQVSLRRRCCGRGPRSPGARQDAPAAEPAAQGERERTPVKLAPASAVKQAWTLQVNPPEGAPADSESGVVREHCRRPSGAYGCTLRRQCLLSSAGVRAEVVRTEKKKKMAAMKVLKRALHEPMAVRACVHACMRACVCIIKAFVCAHCSVPRSAQQANQAFHVNAELMKCSLASMAEDMRVTSELIVQATRNTSAHAGPIGSEDLTARACARQALRWRRCARSTSRSTRSASACSTALSSCRVRDGTRDA
jgi:hypothetical protein